jgi:hypothetical protein
MGRRVGRCSIAVCSSPVIERVSKEYRLIRLRSLQNVLIPPVCLSVCLSSTLTDRRMESQTSFSSILATKMYFKINPVGVNVFTQS